MRARTSSSTNVVKHSLLACATAIMLAGTAPSLGAERPSPTSGMHAHWPATRPNANPAITEQQPARQPYGPQLRPNSEPTGMFSNLLPGGKKASSVGHGPRTPSRRPDPRSAAAERTKGLVPQFMSMFGSKVRPTKPAATRPITASKAVGPVPRTGSAGPVYGNGRAPRSTAQSMQPAFGPAAAGRTGYHVASRRGGPTGATTRSPGHPQRAVPAEQDETRVATSSRPVDLNTVQNGSAPAESGSDAVPSDAARLLVEAHQLAGSANSEEEFSQVVAACQQMPAGRSSAEEIMFSQQLAAWALNRRGQIKAAAGRTDEALADFDASVQLDPERWRAIHNRGVMLAQSGQLEQAFDDFQRTTELDPQFAKAFSNRAALYTLAGEQQAAYRDYARAVELDPKLAVAQRGLGRTCHMLGRPEEGLKHLDAAVALAPNDDDALASRGDLLTDLGHYADAAADYERALELNAESVDACRSSAWLLATCPDDSIRDPELALRRAQQAVRNESSPEADSYATLAAAQAGIGDFQRAVRSSQRAIELASDAERAMYVQRMEMYKQSQPLRLAPPSGVQQASYER